MKIARDIQEAPIAVLALIAVGEEIVFRVGVPLWSDAPSLLWLLLVAIGTALFAYAHAVFGAGQVWAKVPLALAGMLGLLSFGISSPILLHVCYNCLYRLRRRRVGASNQGGGV